jgi:DNA topoisomerase I
MPKHLVIVESPTKARTIEKFLGKDYDVLASYGHIRDLPNNAAEIPEEVKKEKWSRIGVNVDNDFSPLYVIPDKKKKHVADLKKALKDADVLLLATDEDREGESISWHLLEVLKPKIPAKRLVFHEITKEAIKHALESTRNIDDSLVKAQETRRIVDRLFGYSVSPLLWKKMKPKLSAGRVQSVAIKLLVERERERISFRSASYWDLKAIFSKLSSNKAEDQFEAELTHVSGKRIAIGKDFDPKTGKLTTKSDVTLLDAKSATKLKEDLASNKAKVSSIEEKPYTSKPPAPFTTSTLQQEASRKLSFSARRTMQIAQTLYENGLITYMRTDSTTLSEEALNGARSLIEKDFGKEFLYPEPRIYKTKVRNAQEAHEAIRPAGAQFTPMQVVLEKFGPEAFKLYELIWKRTIASQMKDSSGMRIGVQIECGNSIFRASGKTIEFAGFLRAYVEGSDDPESDLADQEKILPKLSNGETLDTKSLDALEHTTQPPARFTEGSLIKELERLGIGRPSTWATIVDLVLSRDYAFKKGTALVPTFLATAVIGLMEKYFTQLVDYEFTARLEDDLDAISRGESEDKNYLQSFYFGNGHPGLKTLVEGGETNIDPRIVCGIPLGADRDGKNVEVRIGRWGPFISNGETRAGLPDMVAPDEMTVERALQLLQDAAKGPEVLGNDPQTNKPIYLKKGRFGPYVQLGDMVEGEDKPKMASLLPGMLPEEVTFDTAIALLSLPRELGQHPETKDTIIAANGRYGPYIKAGTDTRSIPTDENLTPLNITLEQAIEILKQPKRRGRQSTPKNLREIGPHPISQAPIVLKSGRYGPYVTDGKINASLPRGLDPQSLSVQDAVNLLDARAAKIASEDPDDKPKKHSAKKKASAEGKEPKTKKSQKKKTKDK